MRSPCSQRAAKAGGLAQNSTYKCSGDPGWAIGVAFLAAAVGGPVRGIKDICYIFGYSVMTTNRTRIVYVAVTAVAVAVAAVPVPIPYLCMYMFDCWFGGGGGFNT